MYDIKTPAEKLWRRVLTLAPNVTALAEGEWVTPSSTPGQEGMFEPVGATAPTVCYPNWTDLIRPDVRAANLNGSGTITVAFGPHVAITDVFERNTANFPTGVTAYAAGMALTVKNKILLPADTGEAVQAFVEVVPVNLNAGSEMQIVRL